MSKKAIKEVITTLMDNEPDDAYQLGSEWMQIFAKDVEQYINGETDLEDKTIGRVLFGLRNLQVRDYMLGIMDASNDIHCKRLEYLAEHSPAAFRSAPYSLLSLMYYEKQDKNYALLMVAHANKSYALAQLLQRVYIAGWEPERFAQMRRETHPKVTAGIFGEDN